MLYIIPATIVAMSGYVAWLLLFRLRRDRVQAERKLTRGKFAFQPRQRARFLLGKTFSVPHEKADWEDPLVSRLRTSSSETPPSGKDV